MAEARGAVPAAKRDDAPVRTTADCPIQRFSILAKEKDESGTNGLAGSSDRVTPDRCVTGAS